MLTKRRLFALGAAATSSLGLAAVPAGARPGLWARIDGEWGRAKLTSIIGGYVRVEIPQIIEADSAEIVLTLNEKTIAGGTYRSICMDYDTDAYYAPMPEHEGHPARTAICFTDKHPAYEPLVTLTA